MATTTSDCINCGKTASLQCNHVERNGSTTTTRYCSTECQTADWPSHKRSCSAAKYHKRLYRAGELVQQAFYVFRHVGFDMFFERVVRTSDGKLHIYDGIPKDDKVLVRFPEDLNLDQHDKHALLCHLACDEAVVHLHSFASKALRGLDSRILEEQVRVDQSKKRIVQHKGNHDPKSDTYTIDDHIDEHIYQHQIISLKLKDGDHYIIDPAGAQYGQYKAVIPKDEFYRAWVERFIRTARFGEHSETSRQKLRAADSCDWGSDLRVSVVLEMLGSEMDCILKEWEKSAGMDMSTVLKEKDRAYEAKKADLLATLHENLSAFVQESERSGKFTFQRIGHGSYGRYRLKTAESVNVITDSLATPRSSSANATESTETLGEKLATTTFFDPARPRHLHGKEVSQEFADAPQNVREFIEEMAANGSTVTTLY